MKTLIGALFIALGVFPNFVELSLVEKIPQQVYERRVPIKVGSPERVPHRINEPIGPAKVGSPERVPHQINEQIGSAKERSPERVPHQVNEPRSPARRIVSPQRLPGQVHVPKCNASTSCPSPSKGQSGRGGIRITPQEAQLYAELHKSFTRKQKIGLVFSDKDIDDLYYTDKSGFHKICLNDGTPIFDYDGIILGIVVAGKYIAPVFNGAGRIIRVDRNDNNKRTFMDVEEARRWGVFGTVDDFLRRMDKGELPDSKPPRT